MHVGTTNLKIQYNMSGHMLGTTETERHWSVGLSQHEAGQTVSESGPDGWLGTGTDLKSLSLQRQKNLCETLQAVC